MTAPAVSCCAAAKVYIHWDAKLRTFVVYARDGYVEMWFCPWCGVKLPSIEEPKREDAADGC